MKNFLELNVSFILIISLLVTTPLLAQVDITLDQQKADCILNTAMEWSIELNRCIQKKQSQTDRHEADACNAIVDINQRAECHKALAEKKTGLSSDPNSLYQGNTTGSMMLNAAYSVVALINFTGAKGKKSSCTSKTIFGVTAVAGLASDLYLKYSAKKKVEELTKKYKLDVASGSSASQISALEYLKEEQQTVADIAGLEMKRNMLLMLGYGAAGLMAAYELSPMGSNPECAKGEPKAGEANTSPAATTPTAPVTPVTTTPSASDIESISNNVFSDIK